MAVDYSIWVLCYARCKVSGDFMGGSPVATGRIRIQPGVRATEIPGVVNTHVS